MAFCGQCGAGIQEGDLFCRSCGARTAQAPAPVPSAGPAPASPPVVPPTSLPAVAPPSPPSPVAPPTPPTGKKPFPVGVVIAIVVVALALLGGVAGGAFLLWRNAQGSASVSAKDPGSLGFDSEPFDPATVPGDATDAEKPSGEPQEEPAPSDGTAGAKPAPITEMSSDNAKRVVGQMLQAMHEGATDTAATLATEHLLADVGGDRTWFGPGPDVLISFEVKDAKTVGDTVVVTCVEQWNSGPEYTTYTVVKRDRLVVDSIEWGER